MGAGGSAQPCSMDWGVQAGGSARGQLLCHEGFLIVLLCHCRAKGSALRPEVGSAFHRGLFTAGSPSGFPASDTR